MSMFDTEEFINYEQNNSEAYWVWLLLQFKFIFRIKRLLNDSFI
jgi:hypothetical protein